MGGYILGEGGKIAGIPENPLYVSASDEVGGYPEAISLIAPTTAQSGSGAYTASDNVTITLALVDSGSSTDAVFSGFLKYKEGQEMAATGLRRTNGYDEATTSTANNTVSWDIPAGFTFVLRFTASTAGTRSAAGTVSP